MKISELIKLLTKSMDKYGDHVISFNNGLSIDTIVFTTITDNGVHPKDERYYTLQHGCSLNSEKL